MDQLNSEENKYEILIVHLAEYYGKKLSKLQVSMYANDLKKIEYEKILEAVKSYKSNYKNTYFPLPAQLINCLKESASSPDESAVEAAAKIIGAVRLIGPYRIQDAEKHIGPLGWYVVCKMGGWEGVCEMLTYQNIPSLQAQFREIAKSAAVRNEKYNLLDAPKPNENKLKKIGDLNLEELFKKSGITNN